ncbi:hypothetical protein AB1E18_019684 [Capra hircus]
MSPAPPPVVTPGEDATLFRVEAGEDGEAQVDGVVAGIRQGFYLLTEDIFEDVEVVPDEEQQPGSSLELQKTVEEQCQERPGGPSELPALDVLQALATLQGDLSSEPEKTCRAYVWFTCKNHERKKRDLAQKSAIIQGIPGFWANVVILTDWCWFTLAASEQSNMVIHKMVQTSCRGPVDDAGASASGGWTGAEMLPILF